MRISDWSSDVCSSDLVIGLTLFTATLGKLREYGIVKALGAPPGRLAATVVGQAAWSVALGLLVAVAAAASLGAAIGALTPNVVVLIQPSAVLRTGTGAVIVGALGALLPLRRSEEHTSELQSLMRISYAVFCLKKNKNVTISN